MILNSSEGPPDAAGVGSASSRRGRTRRWLTAILVLLAAVLISRLFWPHQDSDAAPRELAMGWRPVLLQSGRGTTQTESFQIDTGQWRIKWSATADEGADPATSGIRIGVHSAVSGRLMSTAIDHRGAGEGAAYVAEEPRPFFLSIESSGLNWKVQVEEGLMGEREGNAPQPASR